LTRLTRDAARLSSSLSKKGHETGRGKPGRSSFKENLRRQRGARDETVAQDMRRRLGGRCDFFCSRASAAPFLDGESR
jgi:hypothetical protein